MPSPTLAILRRRKQLVDQFRVSIGRFILDEGFARFVRRWQSGQIETDPADERATVGGAIGLNSLGFESAENEPIDIGAAPFSVAHLWRGDCAQWLE